MSYKRYIKKNGKLYGPYAYSSHREGDKVISVYEGIVEEEKKVEKDLKSIRHILFLTLSVAIIILLIVLQPIIIGFVTNWPMFHLYINRTGYINESGPTTNATLWTYTAGVGGVYSSPAVANDIVYIGSFDNKAYAINATNGSHIWNYTTNDDIALSSPAVANDIVYFGSYDDNIYALNATNGSKIWNYNTSGGNVENSPAVVNDIVYFGSDTINIFYALNATNGSRIWNYTAGGNFYSSPSIVNGIVYVGSDDDHVYALNATNGSRIWNYSTAAGGLIGYSSPAVVNNIVYISSGSDNFYALNATNGSRIWNYTITTNIQTSPAVANDIVYFGSNNSNITALNATNGSLIWNYNTGANLLYTSSPAVANDIVYIGSEDNKVYALNATNGSLIWRYTTGGIVDSSPAVYNRYVYIGSADGKVYAIGNLSTSDTTLPYIVFGIGTESNNKFVNRNWVYANVTVNETNEANITFNLYNSTALVNSTANTSAAQRTINWTNLADGTYYYNVTVYDNSSNSNSTETRTITVDISPNWVMFHRDIRHTGYAMTGGPITNETLWNYTSGGAIESSPAIASGIVYFGSDDNKLYALNATNGSRIWNYTTGNDVRSSPAVASGIVYVGSRDNKIYALNATNSSHIWNFTTAGDVSSPAIASGIVYIGSFYEGETSEGRVYALNATNGSQIWSYTTGNNMYSSPAVSNGTVYIGSYDDKIYALNATSGSLIWNYTAGGNTDSSPAVVDGIVYIGSYDYKTYALNATNGSLIWNYTAGNATWSSPAIANGIVYIGSNDNKTYALNATNGSLIWNYTTGNSIYSSPAVANSIVYISSRDNKIYAMNATTGASIWNYTMTGNFNYSADEEIIDSSPVLYNDVLYIGSANNVFYALRTSNIAFGSATAANNSIVSRTSIYVNVTVNKNVVSNQNESNITFRLYNASSGSIGVLLNSTLNTTANQREINWTGLGDGEYYYNATINDTQGNNFPTSTRKITLDTTLPYFTYLGSSSFTCSPNVVDQWASISCSCSAYDNYDSDPTESYTRYPSTVSAGAFTTTCTATDDAGNVNSTTFAYTVTPVGGSVPAQQVTPTVEQPTPTPTTELIEEISPLFEKEAVNVAKIQADKQCTPSYQCSEWSSCTISYNAAGNVAGAKTRTCSDSSGCLPSGIETQSCTLQKVDITTETKTVTETIETAPETYETEKSTTTSVYSAPAAEGGGGMLIASIKQGETKGNPYVDVNLIVPVAEQVISEEQTAIKEMYVFREVPAPKAKDYVVNPLRVIQQIAEKIKIKELYRLYYANLTR